MATECDAMDLFPLLTALIGAGVGAILTFTTSIYLDKRRAKDLRHARLRNLLGEIKDNHLSVQTNESFELSKGDATLRLLSTAWDNAKGDIDFLLGEAQEKLRRTYSEIPKFNSVIEYDLALSPSERAKFSSFFRGKAGEIRPLLAACEADLQNYLSK